MQLGITFGLGFLAGTFPSFLNHPSDILISKAYSEPFSNSSFSDRVANGYKKIGFFGLWKGFMQKATIQGTMFGFQWFIYESCRMALDI